MMAYQTLEKTRILRYGRWVEVGANYVLTEKEVEECPNLKAWIRWEVIKEIPEPGKKEGEQTSGTQRSATSDTGSKATATTDVETSDAKPEKKPADTSKPKKNVPT
jgi:hypothetical protein